MDLYGPNLDIALIKSLIEPPLNSLIDDRKVIGIVPCEGGVEGRYERIDDRYLCVIIGNYMAKSLYIDLYLIAFSIVGSSLSISVR